ncbi:MAG: hypothetical protein SCM11_06950 [Bacillota bacterium]|nr:hypothetical protein [Bacillota bacterium]
MNTTTLNPTFVQQQSSSDSLVTRVRQHYTRIKAKIQFWNASTRGVRQVQFESGSKILSPVMSTVNGFMRPDR